MNVKIYNQNDETKLNVPKSKHDPVDVYVGGRVKERRISLKLSQAKIAKSLGITFQQVQKYEKGQNRIGSSRLYKLAIILNVPISYFFEHFELTSGETVNNYISDIQEKGEQIKSLNKLIQTSIHLLETADNDILRKGMINAMRSVYNAVKEITKGDNNK